MEHPAWCSGGRRPLIAGCLSLQKPGMDLPVSHPVWVSNPRPPTSGSRSLANCAIGATLAPNASASATPPAVPRSLGEPQNSGALARRLPPRRKGSMPRMIRKSCSSRATHHIICFSSKRLPSRCLRQPKVGATADLLKDRGAGGPERSALSNNNNNNNINNTIITP